MFLEANWCLLNGQKKSEGEDVRGGAQTDNISSNEHDPARRQIRHTMKMLSGPYPAFDKYHPLEDTILLYNEIWYESSSSDD